jgi:hypothetical protein
MGVQDAEYQRCAVTSLQVRSSVQNPPEDPDAVYSGESTTVVLAPNPMSPLDQGFITAWGATLARVEGQEVFKALAERFPSLRSETDELEYQPSITFRSLKPLPVIRN